MIFNNNNTFIQQNGRNYSLTETNSMRRIKLLKRINTNNKRTNKINNMVQNQVDLKIYNNFYADTWKYKTNAELYKHYLYNCNNSPHCIDSKDKLIKYMKIDFDWKFYVSTYLDSRVYDTYDKAFHHYIMNGIYERKKYKSNHIQKYDGYENNEGIVLHTINQWRDWSNDMLPKVRTIKLPTVLKGLKYNAVLIEFRKLENLEFVLRIAIYNLAPDWSFTVVCGLDNYSMIKHICSKISRNITILKYKITNATINTYNNLLLSPLFWESLRGDKILIYQEDSILFHSDINKFLKYDYIGAPWPKKQVDNSKFVGNGGFSLRTRNLMIYILSKYSITDIKLAPHTRNYCKTSGLNAPPEDVFFTKCMVDYNIGNIANWDDARTFSEEVIKGINPLGGHKFWLNHKAPLQFWTLKIIPEKKVAISSPYMFIRGGGESYLSYIMKFFINKGYKIVFFSNTSIEPTQIRKVLSSYIPNEAKNIYIAPYNKYIMHKYEELDFDYYIEMGNGKMPSRRGFANKNIYHCQFPFDLNKHLSYNYINTYDAVIVNSDYTKKWYNKFIKPYSSNIPCHILYPLCYTDYNNSFIDTEENAISVFNNKKPNSFILVGRIVPFKNIEIVMDVFKKLDKYGVNYTLHIVGATGKQPDAVKLLNIIKKNVIECPNIKLHLDVTNEVRDELLKNTKYYIHAAGLNLNETRNPELFEHFGISIMEALRYNCVPIISNGGYPNMYIKNNINGFIISTDIELYYLVKHLLISVLPDLQSKLINYVKYNNTFLKEFGTKLTLPYYTKELNNIIKTL